MILNRPLNEQECKESQHNYILYCGINGFSYMCLGETILILFAVKLKCPDHLIAVLGGMLYFGFILLPLGKILTAKFGAVRCQADSWVYRNIAALLVAVAAPMALYVNPQIGLIFLFLGSFLFYGFRAAGVVMSQPLVGEIAPSGTRGRLISRSWVFFYSSCVLALLLITLALKLNSSIWTLFIIIIVGTIAGITSSGFLRRISETGEIRILAQKPLLKILPELIKEQIVRRQLIAGMVCNLCVILTVPISMLALKQGYHISDAQALIYFLFQLAACIIGSKLMEKYSDRFGGRKMTILSFFGFYGIAVFWILAPNSFFPLVTTIPFCFCCVNAITPTALQIYFLNTIRKELQVSASIIISVATGVLSGLLGMFLSSGLLKLAFSLNHGTPLQTYKIYFLFVLILLPFFGIFVHRLPKIALK